MPAGGPAGRGRYLRYDVRMEAMARASEGVVQREIGRLTQVSARRSVTGKPPLGRISPGSIRLK